MAMALDDEEDDWEHIIAVTQVVINNNMSILSTLDDEEECLQQQQHDRQNRAALQNPRGPRKKYRHKEALHCIQRDYLGLPDDPGTPLFVGKDFEMMFRITRGRFQRLMEDIAATGNPFYLNRVDCFGEEGASFEARLLLPLKSLAYGVPPHTFTDYFQMSKAMAKKCCRKFDEVVKAVYTKEYLRLPTPTDVKNITKLHKAVHGVDGMFGSLDCMHTYWKNCPVAWQGSFQGKEKKPSIVLEAISDYHLWFWHASYGYAGTLNDKTILNLSPFLASLVDGSFIDVEQQAGAVPFTIDVEEFNKLFVLVDGIYPSFHLLPHCEPSVGSFWATDEVLECSAPI